MKKFYLSTLCILIFTCTSAQTPVNLTVTTDTMQRFLGLGFSIHKAKTYFLPDDATKSEFIFSNSFPAFNSMAFWSYIEEPALRDQLITKAQTYGLKHIIVNTTGYPLTPDEHATTLFNDIEEYIKAGYPIYGTTLMNKPNTDESGTSRQHPEFLTAAAKKLRFKLDSAGYSYVKMGGPSTVEWHPYLDPTLHGAAHGYDFQANDNMLYLQAFLDDAEALACLDAFDFQSYGWSISERIQQIADSLDKDLWVTLAATDGISNENWDWILGPVSTANCLANLNHGVRSWNHWVWDQLIGFNNSSLSPRMVYLQQIGNSFKENALFRKCLVDDSEPTPDMFWNYYDVDMPSNNVQPEIVAASAINPDSSIIFAVQNLAGIHAQHFYSQFYIAESETKNLTVEMDEFKDENMIRFEIRRLDKNLNSTFEFDTMRNGVLEVELKPTELIVMKSIEIIDTVFDVVGTPYHPFANNEGSLKIYPNPTSGHITIESKGLKTNCSIYTISGQKIYNDMIEVDDITYVDLSKYPKGMYFIQYNNKTERLIVQ